MASGVSKDSENYNTEDKYEKGDKMTEKECRVATEQDVESDNEKEDSETDQGFDLTNPDNLIKQLEKVNLTEEDTEELLHEAYKVNMKLKEILRRQEKKRRDRLASAKSAYGPVNRPNSKSHTTTGAAVLPPIQRKGSASSSHKSHDSPKKKDDDTRKTKRSMTSQSTRERPVWDDRFSFS